MVIYAILSLFLFWLLVLTWIILKTKRHYNSLTADTKKGQLDEILEELLHTDSQVKSEIVRICSELDKVIKNAEFHVQKIGLVRFNPFERSAGEQSFVISLVNKHDSGIIMNFIYTKEGLRVYTKKVTEGKGESYALTEEEKKALKDSA